MYCSIGEAKTPLLPAGCDFVAGFTVSLPFPLESGRARAVLVQRDWCVVAGLTIALLLENPLSRSVPT